MTSRNDAVITPCPSLCTSAAKSFNRIFEGGLYRVCGDCNYAAYLRPATPLDHIQPRVVGPCVYCETDAYFLKGEERAYHLGCDLEEREFTDSPPSSLVRAFGTPELVGGLDATVAAITRWQRETFPDVPVTDIVAHLLEEVHELVAKPNDPLEIADVVMLAVCLADRQGVDLNQALQDKLKINQSRTWGANHRHVK